MGVIGLVLLGNNNEICHNGKLTYRFKSDMKNFNKVTSDSINVIIGSKTFKENYFPLPNRFHMVITRELVHHGKLDQNITYSSYENMLNIIKHNKMSNFCVIGGMTIYTLFKDIIDTWYVTKVEQSLTKVPISEDDKIFDINEMIPKDKFKIEKYKLYMEPNQLMNDEIQIYSISKYVRL